MGFTILSPDSDEESTIAQTHAAHRQGGVARQRAGAKAKAVPASSGGGRKRRTHERAESQEAVEETAVGAAGGLPIAAAERSMPSAITQTAHQLGLSMSISEETLTAVELQTGGGINMTVTDLANIPELFFMRALDGTRIGDSDLAPFSQQLEGAGVQAATAIPPVLASRLVQWWRRAQVLCPPEMPIPPPQKIEITQVMAEGMQAQGSKRKMEGVVDQRDDTLYTPLSDEEISMMRLRFWKKTGDHPPENERPSNDQLTALAGRLATGRSPWVDFAVWTSYGSRKVKENSFRPQVWVNGQLETKTIAGPPDHDAWLAHFRVFRAAMVMCRGASPATLDRYALGIRNLLLRYPGSWGLVCIADEIVRGEQWPRLMEEAKADPEYDEDNSMPWDDILKGSAFRIGSGTLQEFWDQHVLHPATLLKGDWSPSVPQPAINFISAIEGHAPPGGSVDGGGKGKKGKHGQPQWPQPAPFAGKSAQQWAQLAIADQEPWPHAPDAWTRKDAGAWSKGKDPKGKGKKGKGAKGKGDKSLTKKERKAQAAGKAAGKQTWNAWMRESAGK